MRKAWSIGHGAWIFALLFALCALHSEAAEKVFDQNWDASVGSAKTLDLQWFGGDSIDYTHRARWGSRPVALTNATQVLLWEVTGTGADRTNCYLSVTGAVQSAAGIVHFEATTEQANLVPGDYLGFVRSMTPATSKGVTLCYQKIRITWSPESDEITHVQPLTNYYTAAEVDSLINAQYSTLTGQVASVEGRVASVEGQTNYWNTAYGWGNHAGLYLLLNDWSAASNALWGAVGGKLEVSVFNSWTNAQTATNAVLQAQIATNQSAITNLQSSVSAVSGRVTSVEGRVTSAESSITNLTSDLGSLTSAVATGKVDVADFQPLESAVAGGSNVWNSTAATVAGSSNDWNTVTNKLDVLGDNLSFFPELIIVSNTSTQADGSYLYGGIASSGHGAGYNQWFSVAGSFDYWPEPGNEGWFLNAEPFVTLFARSDDTNKPPRTGWVGVTVSYDLPSEILRKAIGAATTGDVAAVEAAYQAADAYITNGLSTVAISNLTVTGSAVLPSPLVVGDIQADTLQGTSISVIKQYPLSALGATFASGLSTRPFGSTYYTIPLSTSGSGVSYNLIPYTTQVSFRVACGVDSNIETTATMKLTAIARKPDGSVATGTLTYTNGVTVTGGIQKISFALAPFTYTNTSIQVRLYAYTNSVGAFPTNTIYVADPIGYK